MASTRTITIERLAPMSGLLTNSCNHPKDPNDEEAQALDYYTELKRTHLMNYAHLIDYKIDWTYEFTQEEMEVLSECATIGFKVGASAVLSEIEPLVQRLKTHWHEGKWFFRFNSMSPKDGNPIFPIMRPMDVIKKLVSSKRTMNAMLLGDTTLYFVAYKDGWDTRRELRVFVRKGKVTAVSQYDAYRKGYLSKLSDQEITELIHQLQYYLEGTILPKVCPEIGTYNLVCDLYVEIEGPPKIIEFNSFGYWMACGSALFHWIEDKALLYNEDGNSIHVKIIG